MYIVCIYVLCTICMYIPKVHVLSRPHCRHSHVSFSMSLSISINLLCKYKNTLVVFMVGRKEGRKTGSRVEGCSEWVSEWSDLWKQVTSHWWPVFVYRRLNRRRPDPWSPRGWSAKKSARAEAMVWWGVRAKPGAECECECECGWGVGVPVPARVYN